ncbi:preferentially expressed antigen in melanoma-like protein 7 [Lineus longissimus]|uniref:preferentially expressed antigen in melanoma-like protein 7 n=1 Tax=Lineus longissimus TaxID=88925 RepID=UPI00315DA7F1
MDTTFLNNCKGALYPVNLDGTWSDISSGDRWVTPLLDLCSECIVKDSTMTKNTLDVVPNDLFVNLMRAALLKEKDRAISVILSHWPWQSLVLSKFVSDEKDPVTILYNRNVLAWKTRRAMKYTTCLVTNFVDCLKKRAPTRLKYLDLTGFPAAEVVTHYLCTHCLLISNESRQREIIHLYNETASQIPHLATNKYDFRQTFPDESFMIKLDVYVKTEEIMKELVKALQLSKLAETNLKVLVDKVDISCLGETSVMMLMDQLNEEVATGLRLQFTSLTGDSLIRMQPSFCRLTNLVSLDLSCNSIVLPHNPKAVESLCAIFKELPNLQRLDLSNNWVRENVRQILSAVQSPLLYLNLSGCCLKEVDLVYLASSHHITTIEELDIGENNLSTCCTSLTKVLKACQNQVRIVEMEGCKLNDANLATLSPVLQTFSRLLYINLTDNRFTAANVMSCVKYFAALTSLCALKMTFPVDFEDFNVYEEELMEANVWHKTAFCLKFEQILRSKGSLARLAFTDYE